MSADAPDAPQGPFLLCYDGSEDAGEAIHGAGAITGGGGAAIVVHVWCPPSAVILQGQMVDDVHPLAAATEEFDRAARAEAERVAARGAEIAAAAGFDARPLALESAKRVWHPLVELAAAERARAIVAGTHGASIVRTAVLGSTSHAIVAHSSRPVILVPLARQS